MSDGHGLLLALYAGSAGVLLIAGYIWKEVRDRRAHRKRPQQLKFDAKPETEKKHPEPLLTQR
jgi:hypothetical protein